MNLKTKLIFSASMLAISYASATDMQPLDDDLIQRIVTQGYEEVFNTPNSECRVSAIEHFDNMKESQSTVFLPGIEHYGLDTSYYLVANMFFQGSSVPQNRQFALELYKKTLEIDEFNYDALFAIGKYHEFGFDIIEPNLDQAIHCYRLAISRAEDFSYQDYVSLYLQLGKALIKQAEGINGDDNRYEANQFFAQALALCPGEGHPEESISSVLALAQIYTEGLGVLPDLEKAKAFYTRALTLFNQDIMSRSTVQKIQKSQQKLRDKMNLFLKVLKIDYYFFHQECRAATPSEEEKLEEDYLTDKSIGKYWQALSNEMMQFKKSFMQQDKDGFMTHLKEMHRLSHVLDSRYNDIIRTNHPNADKILPIDNAHQAYLLLEAIQNNEVGSEFLAPFYTKMLGALTDLGHLKAQDEKKKITRASRFAHRGF